MKRILLPLFLFLLVNGIQAQTVLGKWKTIDDKTGQEKSIVELYLKDGKLYGKIITVFKLPNKPLKTNCTACTDYRKDALLVGMDIITNLEKDNNEWKNDDAILDPENGKLYDCKIWLTDTNTLAVRGYIGFFYRTQYWTRVDE